ncbi:MAG: PIN domain-containing protein [Chloroflexi bacterium]|nr:PIN domain-containing protein [Chloroflexota bacterium]
MVIADTSAWIAFQTKPDSEFGRQFDALLAGDEIVMVGPVLAELLQGARSESDFSFFAERLGALAFLEADQATWIKAGELNYQLRARGRIIPMADLIVSALAIQHGIPVYTSAKDYQEVPGLQIYEPAG